MTSPPRVTPEAASAFIERRLRPQLTWSDGKSKHAKNWHIWLMGTHLLADVGRPVESMSRPVRHRFSVPAGVAAIGTGFARIRRHRHEHWLTYREAANALRVLASTL